MTKRYLASAAPVEVKINVNKKVQKITWNPPAEIFVDTKLGDSNVLKAQVEDNAVMSFSDGKDTLINDDTVLPAGKGQTLKLRVAATATYDEVTVPVTKTIDVNKHQQDLTWGNPSDITVETQLDGTHLNASVKDNANRIYRDAMGKVIQAGDTLPAGLNQTLTVESEETALYEASPKPVPVVINVNKLKQTITWNPRKELTLGMKLGDGVLTAETTSKIEPTYKDEKNNPVDETTVLPVGSHKLTAFAEGTDRFDPAEPVPMTITVNPKVEEEK